MECGTLVCIYYICLGHSTSRRSLLYDACIDKRILRKAQTACIVTTLSLICYAEMRQQSKFICI
jgi:hypothetical protein